MAFTNALYSVVSTKFSEGVKKASVLPFLTNTTWEGDAQNGEVKIISVGDATLRTYAPGTPITVDTGSALANTLKLDQYKYFAHDVDSTESLTGAYLAKYTEKALASLRVQNDGYVLNTLTGTFTTNAITGAAAAPVAVNSANILDVIFQASDMLRVQGGLTENAFICLPSQWVNMVVKAAGKTMMVSNDSYFQNGNVPKIAGLNVVDSPAYTFTTTTLTNDTAIVLFGNVDAISNAANVGNLETIDKLETAFGVRTKCLMRYGAKITEEKLGGYAKLKRIAEV